MKNTVNVPIFILSCTLCLFLQSCSNTTKPKANAGYVIPNSLLKTLQITTVANDEYANTITLTGQVDFDEDHVIQIYPMVSGVAQGINVMQGDFVQRNQLLGVIKSPDITSFSNDVESARINLQMAKRNKQSTISMYKSGLASGIDSLNAVMQYQQAKAALNKAERILQNTGSASGSAYYMRTPINGFIVAKNINNGMVIRPDNSSSLFTISNLKTVWVIANVYESNIPYVKEGDSVSVKTLSYPGKIFRGKIDKVMNVLDPQNRVMKVRIVLNNPGYLLKPQMFANVEVSYSENKKMPVVPSSALIFDNSQDYVLVYKSPSDVTIHPVQVSGQQGNNVYLSSGVQEGEKVIASQTLLIYQALNN